MTAISNTHSGPYLDSHMTVRDFEPISSFGKIFKSHIEGLKSDGCSRGALIAMMEVNCAAAAGLNSLPASLGRLEGASAYPMLATAQSCADVADTIIKGETLKTYNQESEVIYPHIVRIGLNYLSKAVNYLEHIDTASAALAKIISTDSLGDETRLKAVKALCGRSNCRKAVKDIILDLDEKGDKFKPLLSEYLHVARYPQPRQELAERIQEMIDGKRELPTELNLADFSFTKK